MFLLHKLYVAPLALSVLTFAMSGCLSSGSSSSGSSPGDPPGSGNPQPALNLSVLSSSPEQVSGGSILVTVQGDAAVVNTEIERLEFWLNDRRIEPSRLVRRNDRFEILLDGLALGQNELELHHAEHGPLDSISLTNHPITGPIFSGPHQYPFVCSVAAELGKQPLVDTDDNTGFPVFDSNNSQIGLSKDCSIETYVEFFYRAANNTYKPLPVDRSRPSDMTTTTLTDGRVVDFIVRREIGTINRFIYSFATLANLNDADDSAATNLWNGRAMFHFLGGVAIGHSQGRMDNRSMVPEVLGKGYAVLFSTGTRTSTHYNLQVGGETALMVKEHFVKRFGMPEYTIAIGGSGGGIQQYVYAQNHPGLLDGGVPQYSYPDMVTQTIHIGDCELLEHYMDVTDRTNPLWRTTGNRSWLVGLNSTDEYPDPLAAAKTMLGYSTAPGMTECIPAWRGLTPLVMNPLYGEARNQQLMQPPGVMNSVQWTHYDDLRNIYGVDPSGQPRTIFDNVGVQYGLQALKDGNITPNEFIRLNSQIGGWKHPRDMVQEGFPFLGTQADVMLDPSKFDPWSRRNMLLSPDGVTPAPRTEGNLQAINAAYDSGMVFDGELNIPVIDWRHYLEEVLDMHNSHQSFSGRQRIINKMGHADNQVIWFTDARPTDTSNAARPRPADNFDQTWQALDVLHDWITNIRQNPDLSIAANKPAGAVDSCFSANGQLIASGQNVWDGILDDGPAGACAAQFPTYTTSRMVAGGPIEGSVFKCSLKPVSAAINDGTYSPWAPSAGQQAELEAIFPTGVCDYTQPDQGRPRG